ncbi:MAG: response regulator transcription factor [Caldisericia bacterium]|jgi:DNA-binding response OmpR family regulator|nr:response regulator transcription factor [Caldisericia bacterium]
MNEKIGIVDDEKDILELIDINLKNSGYKTFLFENGESALKWVEKENFDLMIIDLMLPDIDGFELIKLIKNRSPQTPIIILTAKGSEIDKIVGFEIGGDDYIVKPFSVRELIARVKALLRRAKSKQDEEKIVINENFIIYPKKYEVYIDNEEINLTKTEFNILLTLYKRKGEVLTRDELLDILWGMDKIVIDRTIDVHIKHLRDKLKNFGSYIKNVRGVGYKFEEE